MLPVRPLTGYCCLFCCQQGLWPGIGFVFAASKAPGQGLLCILLPRERLWVIIQACWVCLGARVWAFGTAEFQADPSGNQQWLPRGCKKGRCILSFLVPNLGPYSGPRSGPTYLIYNKNRAISEAQFWTPEPSTISRQTGAQDPRSCQPKRQHSRLPVGFCLEFGGFVGLG